MAGPDMTPGRLVVPAVRALSPYVPGKPVSELERELGIHDIAKLASNENPYGPGPAALAAMHRALDDIWIYPDGSAYTLKRALSSKLDVDPACLTLGNGSNELLMLLAEAFLTERHSAVYSQYGFAIYPLVINATGARAIEVPAFPADGAMPLGHNLKAMAAAADASTRLILIANPNNPTGTWLRSAELEQFLDAAPADALVVLDEAYLEYSLSHGGVDGLRWRAAYPNLVLLRTFSKAYGLAGARVGYAISHPEVAEALNRLRPAFNVNTVAMAGACAALADESHMQRSVAATLVELQRLVAGLQQLGLRCIPSTTNFVLVHIGAGAARANDQLLRDGIIVRPVGGYGLSEYLRISVGLPEQTEKLLRTLTAFLGTAA
jgi:histidinol-phosphate aminotransferase